jgi:tol-pal system protein YbgF
MRCLSILGLPILAFLALASPAAVGADPGALRAEAGQLVGELGAARRRLAQLQEPASRTAALEARLGRMEEDLRRLTGRIEELEYRQTQLSARLDRLENQAATAAAPQPPAPPAVLRPQPPPAAAAAPPAVEPDAAARQGYVLGTLPPDVLRGGPSAGERPSPPLPRQPGTPDEAYQQGLELLQAGRWPEAEQAFAAFVAAKPEDARAPTAAYWQAETHFFRRDYETAAAMFARNYRSYGEDAPRAADNLLKLGMSLAALGDRERACQTFGELAKRHPDAPAPIRQALSRERAAAGCG